LNARAIQPSQDHNTGDKDGALYAHSGKSIQKSYNKHTLGKLTHHLSSASGRSSLEKQLETPDKSYSPISKRLKQFETFKKQIDKELMDLHGTSKE
jgi:hypothetical protein